MLPHLNLRPKVTAAVLAVSLAAMTAAVFMAHRAMRETVRAEYRRSAAAVARGLATAAKVPMAVGDKDELGRLASLSLQANGLVHVHFTDRAGRDLTHIETEGTDSDHDELISGVADVLTPQRGDEDLDQFDTPQTSDGAPMLRLGSVEVGIPAAVVDARMFALSGLFVRIVLGAGLVIGAIMWVLAGAWTRRLDRLVEASERIARGELDSPLADPSGDEIGRLTDAFSRMRLAVKQRDREARQFNETLQEQVRARTSDLEEAMHAAQAANRAKSDFLANMSHEIRTPMTAILGFAELLNDPGQTADAKRDCVSTISRSGKHLLTIINDILDISKIEAGKMTVEPIPCEPVAIIHDAVSLMRERAAEQGIELKTLFDSPIPQTISCDPLRLRQILLNLVGNAVKFTQQGSVTLHVTADPAAQTFTVAVQDTGIGIAPENAANLFRPFSQSDNTMTRRFGGTGLGLTIARRFAELLGGSLTFVSAPGKGSTFTVTVATGPLDGVPMVSGTASAKPAAPAPQTPGTQ
ncbi:MAG: HAMP domain-containing protein, partial [Phycisphaerales bacterium]|nr:HAMP domain-containing protein [Phycisphaerales bacterium]